PNPPRLRSLPRILCEGMPNMKATAMSEPGPSRPSSACRPTCPPESASCRWDMDPMRTFQRLRDCVVAAIAIIVEVHRRAEHAAEAATISTVAGDCYAPLRTAVEEAQALWLDTPMAGFLDAPAPVYLDKQFAADAICRLGGSCWHDLAIKIAAALT